MKVPEYIKEGAIEIKEVPVDFIACLLDFLEVPVYIEEGPIDIIEGPVYFIACLLDYVFRSTSIHHQKGPIYIIEGPVDFIESTCPDWEGRPRLNYRGCNKISTIAF